MARDMGWVQPYEQSMALCGYIAQGNCNQRKVEEYWHRAFNCVAKYLGFNKATRKILWEDLACGNWEHLHKTDEEEARTPDDWLDKLYWDVHYCSDRWALDRLTRCHWLWRQYELALWRQNEKDLSEGDE